MIKLRESNKIEGILLLNNQSEAPENGFSTAKKVPNEWVNGEGSFNFHLFSAVS